jgi:hypothetical protein
MRMIKPVEVLVEDGRTVLVLEDQRRIGIGLQLQNAGFTYAVQRIDGVAAFELTAEDLFAAGHPVEGMLWAMLIVNQAQTERLAQLAGAVSDLAKALEPLAAAAGRPMPSVDDIMARASVAVATAMRGAADPGVKAS